MGNDGVSRNIICNTLEKLGYSRVINYATKKSDDTDLNNKDYMFVSEDDFFRMSDKNMLINWTENNGCFYGLARPIGSKNNVTEVDTVEELNTIKKMYGKQAIAVCIGSAEKLAGAEIDFKVKFEGAETTTANILKYLHERQLRDEKM